MKKRLVARSRIVKGICAAVLVAWFVVPSIAAEAAAPPPSGWGVIQEQDYSVVTYAGSWRVDQDAGAVGGAHATASQYMPFPGYPWPSTVLVEFSGTRAQVIAPTGPDAGKADVFVDYVRVATIDQYSASALDTQVVYDTGTLAAGDHTISLVATGNKNPASSNVHVRFDAVYHQAPASPPSCQRGGSYPSSVRDVTAPRYSAPTDGVTNARPAIQRALDDAAAAGGGTVLLPAGCTFLTGSLMLSSNTTLKINGTLLQSQVDSHYGYTPLRGHDIAPSDPAWDHAGFHNLPLVLARDVHDVAVTGSGRIKLTMPPIGQRPIELWPVGFSEVSRFAVRDVSVHNGNQFGITMFNSDHGIVANTDVLMLPAGLNTNAVTIENSQHVRLTGSRLVTSDDAVHLSSSFRDPRSYQPSWWSTDVPEPVHDIEIDNSHITNHGNPYCSCPYGKAIAFVAWGGGASDLRDVEISKINIHDNVLNGYESIGCWCNNWYITGAEQSPISDVRIVDNEYLGTTSGSWAGAVVTDIQTDFGKMGSRPVVNGGFESTGTAWWGWKGDAGATNAAGASVLRSQQARAARNALDPDGWVGYLQPRGSDASLYEGLGLTASIPGAPFGQVTYDLRADVVTSGHAMKLFAYNKCTGQELASLTVRNTQVQRVTLPFRLSRNCSDVQIGIEQAPSGTRAWGLIDNVTVDWGELVGISAVDDSSSTITYAGSWATYPSYPPGADWGGTHTTEWAAGASATMPFTGSRAVVSGLVGDNGGLADVYLDGTKVATVDYYSRTFAANSMIYDTGQIAAGQHELRLVATGTKVDASIGTFINIDALFAKPAQ